MINSATGEPVARALVQVPAAEEKAQFTGDVDLTVTLAQGQVTGVVQLEGKPAAGVMVLLVPESGREMEEDSRIDESDSDGTFSLSGFFPETTCFW